MVNNYCFGLKIKLSTHVSVYIFKKKKYFSHPINKEK